MCAVSVRVCLGGGGGGGGGGVVVGIISGRPAGGVEVERGRRMRVLIL